MPHLPGGLQHPRGKASIIRQRVHHHRVIGRDEQRRPHRGGQQQHRYAPDRHLVGKQPQQRHPGGNQEQRHRPHPPGIMPVVDVAGDGRQPQAEGLVGQQNQHYDPRTVAQAILHHYWHQGEDDQHGQVASGVAEQGHREILALEVAKIEEGVDAAQLQHHEQPGQGQAQYVHRDMVAQGLRRGERLRPVVEVGAGKDESTQHGHQDRRRQVVDIDLFPLLQRLLIVVLQDRVGKPNGRQPRQHRRDVNQPPAEELQEQPEHHQADEGAEPGGGNRHGKGPASLRGFEYHGNDGVGIGDDQRSAKAAHAAPKDELVQTLRGGGQQA